MVEKIAGFLGDNALTRSWADSMDRYVISPVERMVVSDEVMRERVAQMVGSRLPVDGRLSSAQIRAMEALKGGAVNVDLANAVIAQGASRDDAVSTAATLASNLMQDSYSRDRASRAASELIDGRTGLTDVGDDMRQFWVGGPVAAYSAVGAGTALGVAGGLEAYDWWVSQQQQAEKDKQLPLTGGVQ
jgi:hypothetical protein